MLNPDLRLVSTCIAKGLERLLAAYSLSTPILGGWESPEWQRLKRLIARVIANCLCRATMCPVYLTDVHGGEPSQDLGGKDIDLILGCEVPQAVLHAIEEVVEKVTATRLHQLLGRDPYTYLGIPNVVEIHGVHEYLFKKYVEAGAPYVIRLC